MKPESKTASPPHHDLVSILFSPLDVDAMMSILTWLSFHTHSPNPAQISSGGKYLAGHVRRSKSRTAKSGTGLRFKLNPTSAFTMTPAGTTSTISTAADDRDYRSTAVRPGMRRF